METLTTFRGKLELPIVLTCEHAGCVLPEEYGLLGIDSAHLAECPDAYDRGAGRIFDGLVQRLGCFGVKSTLCRLLIDLNRYVDQTTLIPTHCGHDPIPANQGLPEAERARRIRRYYLPYRERVLELLRECEARHGAAFLFPIHTMAERRLGEVREMDFSFVCKEGCGMAPELCRLVEGAGYRVSVNEPFCLARDVLRVPDGSPCERFNPNAVLIETNDRHRRDPRIVDALADALRTVVSRRWSVLTGGRPLSGAAT